MNTPINFPDVIKKFDTILERGLCSGLGNPDGQMCIEAAICAALDLPHGDNPQCVAPAVRDFKISLNDAAWSSPAARAKGLRDLGIAQIGSRGIVDDWAFRTRLVEETIRQLIPHLFRHLPSIRDNKACQDAATACEREGTADAAVVAARAAWAARAVEAAVAAEAAWAARAARAVEAAVAAEAAWAAHPDYYLLFSAHIALDILRELKSPGVQWL